MFDTEKIYFFNSVLYIIVMDLKFLYLNLLLFLNSVNGGVLVTFLFVLFLLFIPFCPYSALSDVFRNHFQELV